MPDARFRAWLAVALWIGVIMTASSDAFSGQHTGAILLPVLRALLPGAAPETVSAVHAAVRKMAHLVEYLVLGVLLVRALREHGPLRARTLVLALLLGTAVAGVDEFHQRFVPSRTGALRDVALDASGVAVGAFGRGALRRRVAA